MLKKLVGAFGTYIIFGKPLGAGGMGTVYHANWIGPGGIVISVAIKELHRLVTDESRELFLEEARIMGQLNHSGIVKIFNVFELEGRLYLVMEWVDGVNLRELLEAYGRPFDFVTSCFSLGQLLDAVAHAHDHHVAGVPQAIIHYDIKLENILISSSGEVKLTDWGISRFAAMSEQTMSEAIGTLRCMPPEQLLGRARLQSDIYCCGVVTFEMFAWPEKWRGDVPREQLRPSVASGHIPDLNGLGIEPWLVELLRSMLAVDINHRPRAAEANLRIVDKVPWLQRGRTQLTQIYAQVIGPKRSGGTDLHNFGFDAPEVEVKSLLGTPSNSLGSKLNATPDEPTTVEPRGGERAVDEDSPIVIRRPRNRATPIVEGPAQQTKDRTFTKGPPMLDAIPPAAVAEAPPVPVESSAPAVEPTELLPPFFPEDVVAPPEVDAPAQQTLPYPGARTVPTDTPSQPLALAPVSRPDPRLLPLRILAWVGGVGVLVLLGVLISLLSKQPAAGEAQPTAVDRVEVASRDEETPPSEATTEAQPEIPPPATVPKTEEVTKPDLTEPEPTEAIPAPTVDPQEALEETVKPSTEEVPTVEPVKPKSTPKKSAPKTVQVAFVIADVRRAELDINGKTSSYRGSTLARLRVGKTYTIRWRPGPKNEWYEPGKLTVKPLFPGEYYEVQLTEKTVKPNVSQQGAGK